MYLTESFNKSWQILKQSNFYRGFGQSLPSKKTFSALYNSPISNAICSQLLYLNLTFYFLPVIFLNLIFNPLMKIIGSYIDPYSILENITSCIGNFYLIQIFITMFIYNTILTICASNAAEVESQDINTDKGKICSCDEKSKLRYIIKGPLYYLSNHITIGLLRSLLPSALSLPLKIPVYGQALADTYLANTGACVLHRRQWHAEHNTLTLGIGTSFALTLSLLEILLNASTANLGSLGTFLAQDMIFNLVWIFFIFNIHINPSILLSSTEYSCDIFSYNNLIVDAIFDDAKPKVKALVERLENGGPNTKIQTTLKSLLFILSTILPPAVKDPKKLLASPPMQLFFAQHRNGLLTTSSWIKTIIGRRSLLLSADRILPKNSLKKFLTRWLPETLVKLLFISLNKDIFSQSRVENFERIVSQARIHSNKNNFISRFLSRIFTRDDLDGFIVIGEISPPILPPSISPAPKTELAPPESPTEIISEVVPPPDENAWIVISEEGQDRTIHLTRNDLMPLYQLLSGRMTNQDLPASTQHQTTARPNPG